MAFSLLSDAQPVMAESVPIPMPAGNSRNFLSFFSSKFSEDSEAFLFGI